MAGTSVAPHPHYRVRQFNKHVLNPVMRLAAGRRHWYAAALHHVGRRSGRAYITPVVAEPVPGGFVIPLPYGANVDWLRNVRAAGQATITVEGYEHAIDQPTVVPAREVLPLVRDKRRRVWARLGIENFLRVREVDH